MAFKLHIPDEVKIACMQAIAGYCEYKKVKVNALDELIGDGIVTRQKLMQIKVSMRNVKSISEQRKQDIDNLIDIIDNIDTTVGSLYSALLGYLNKMKTGFWIFNTGNSELKNQFAKIMQIFSPVDWDKKLEQSIIEQMHANPTDQNVQKSGARVIAFTNTNLSRYEQELGRAKSPPPESISSLSSTGHILETMFTTPPGSLNYDRSFEEHDNYTAGGVQPGSINGEEGIRVDRQLS